MTAKRVPRLTQLTIDKTRPVAGKRLDLPDGPRGIPGFAIRISERGVKTFTLRYRVTSGAQRRLTLGQHPIMTLMEARQAARDALRLVEQGIDPAAKELEARRERERNTVAAVLTQYTERHLKPNTRRWRDTEAMLRRELLPHWAHRPARSICRRDVLELVDAINDRGSPVSANRVLSLIRRMWNWAIERGVVESNPASALRPPHRERPRDRVLEDVEIASLWAAWNQMGYPFGTIQKLLLLTGQRRGEVASMRWDQLDLDREYWRLASAETKAGREHIVPLSLAVLLILRDVPRINGSPLVFPAKGTGRDRPASGFSKAKRLTDRLSGIENWTWHDLRRTAATSMARLNVPPHVVERILNHTPGSMGLIARVYNVHSYQSEMRLALDAWAREVERITRSLPAKAA